VLYYIEGIYRGQTTREVRSLLKKAKCASAGSPMDGSSNRFQQRKQKLVPRQGDASMCNFNNACDQTKNSESSKQSVNSSGSSDHMIMNSFAQYSGPTMTPLAFQQLKSLQLLQHRLPQAQFLQLAAAVCAHQQKVGALSVGSQQPPGMNTPGGMIGFGHNPYMVLNAAGQPMLINPACPNMNAVPGQFLASTASPQSPSSTQSCESQKPVESPSVAGWQIHRKDICSPSNLTSVGRAAAVAASAAISAAASASMVCETAVAASMVAALPPITSSTAVARPKLQAKDKQQQKRKNSPTSSGKQKVAKKTKLVKAQHASSSVSPALVSELHSPAKDLQALAGLMALSGAGHHP